MAGVLRSVSCRRSVLVPLAALAIALLPAPGSAAATGPQDAPPTGPVLRGPTAKLAWRMADRYERGWQAWRPSSGTYDRAYVHPRAWTVTFDGCGSLGHGQPLTRFDVTVRGVGFRFTATSGGSSCRRTIATLPRLGRYDVALTVRTARGGRDRIEERITLRDRLVVSLGDSMASGEGVPDTLGRYRLRNDLDSTADVLRFLAVLALGHPRPASDPDFAVEERVPVRWRDKRCHRSARAGHALTARELERRDPHSSVTYLSLACSGAEIEHLLDTAYDGQQPPANPQPDKLRPQLAVLADLLRTRAGQASGARRAKAAGVSLPWRPPAGTRRVDALLMAIGINDLGFADIVKACARNPATPHYGDPGCVTGTGVNTKLDGLGAKYDRLARGLRTLDIGETYITDYPGAPFGREDGGCGMLGLRGFGIGTQEAHEMYLVGRHFNALIRAAANRNGWNYADGMTERFLGHDYCEPSGERFFVRLEESLDGQGTEHGAVHPNRLGHGTLGNLLLSNVVFDRPAYPFVRTRVVIEQVKLGSSFHDRLDDVLVTFHRSRQQAVEVRRGVGYMGRWRDIGLAFDLDVYDPPRPPRIATALDFGLRAVNGGSPIAVHHDAHDTWGLGPHEVASPRTDAFPDGYLRVRYRVEAERIRDPNGLLQPIAR